MNFVIKLPEKFKIVSKNSNLPWSTTAVIDEQNDTIYFFGGIIKKSCSNVFFKFVVPKSQWTKLEVPIDVTPRVGHQMLYNEIRKEIYILGGIYGKNYDTIERDGICCKDSWIYNIEKNEWNILPYNKFALNRVTFSSVLNKEREKIYFISGLKGENDLITGFSNSIYEYNINTMKFKKIISDNLLKRAGATAIWNQKKKVILCYGGWIQKKNKGGIGFNDLLIIDPEIKKIKKRIMLKNITPRSISNSFLDEEYEIMFIYGGLHGGYEVSRGLWYYSISDSKTDAVFHLDEIFHQSNPAVVYHQRRKNIYFFVKILHDINEDNSYLISYPLNDFLQNFIKN